MARRKEPRIPDHLLDQLLAGADAQSAFAKDGLLDELKKALAERALNADHHLEGETGNSCNGYGRKSVLTDTGKIDLEIPRDRQASFDPQLIAKYQKLDGGDPVLRLPEEVRRIIYTTNAIEALNAKLRRAVQARGHFPTDESAIKLLFLVLRQAQKEWKMPPREWGMAKAQFAILFEDRFRPV
jgi:transposase-like protein